MTEQEVLDSLRDAVVRGDSAAAVQLAEQVVTQGIDPLKAFEEGLRDGIREVGDGFAQEVLFLPDLVIAADTMKAAAEILEKEISRSGREHLGAGKIVLGTVAGDLHDIGKTIVATLLNSHGFEVIDLGVNIPTEVFVSTVRDEKPDIIGMSSLLTVTAKEIAKVVEALEEAGVRDQVKVITGGGAVTEEFTKRVGADGYGHDAELGVRVVKKLLGVD